MRKPLVVSLLTLIAVIGFAACSSDSSSSSDTSSTTKAKAAAPVNLSGQVNDKGTKNISTKGSSTEIEVELDDFYIEPTYIQVAPGQKVKIELENEGSVAHTFTSTALNVDKELQPDTKATIEVTVPMTGDAPFFCRFHKSSGMQGAVFISS